MKVMNRALLVAMLVSVGFNVFFISGYFSARSTLEKLGTHEGRIQLLSRKLDLTRAQEARMIDYWREMEREVEEFKQLNENELNAFWEEMIKDEPDADKIGALMKATAAQQEDMRVARVRSLQKIFSLLSQEQRRQIAQMIKDRSFIQQLQR